MSNPLDMSDEDFGKLSGPTPAPAPEKTAEELAAEAAAAAAPAGAPAQEQEQEQEQEQQEELTEAEKAAAAAGEEEGEAGAPAPAPAPAPAGAPAASPAAAPVAAAPGVDPSKAAAAPVAAAPAGSGAAEVIDYEASFKQIMKPFKANGKMIEPRSVEEAVQLMQMGANYTRKMQDIQPHRKVLLMLENNGLLDEGKLSFLIDLEKKNPDAIKKLVKDAGIDPMEIDVSAESTYREGNHRVTDDEAGFRTVLDDLGSSPEGKQTLVDINTRWDQASKEALWKEPAIMTMIHEQRSNGIYDRIVAEVEHQRTIGQIPPNTPFLQAYKVAGDALVSRNAFDDLEVVKQAKPTAKAAASPAVAVATTVAKPKPAVTNGAAASAASATRSTPRKAEKFVNPLAMSDDAFLAQMNQRV